jgi:hypothetical protein
MGAGDSLGDGDRAAEQFSLLNRINRSRAPADVHRYKVEPYVVVADVYAAPHHAGRGGRTRDTGSAAWMQRTGLESILGLHMRGGVLHLDPCIPKTWPRFEMTVRYRSSRYEANHRDLGNPNRNARAYWVPGADECYDRGTATDVGVPLSPTRLPPHAAAERLI